MSKFELADWTTVELTDVGGRKEIHGETKVQAIDVSFKWETTQEALALFSERLLKSWYYNQAAEAGQETADGIPKTLPNLQCPKIKMPVQWDLELTGYTAHFDYGLGEKAGSNLVLANSKVNKFRLTVKEGGTVIVQAMVQCNSDVNETLLGKLGVLEGAKVPIKLLRPLVDEVIDGSKGPGTKKPKKGAAKDDGQQQLSDDKDPTTLFDDQPADGGAPAGNVDVSGSDANWPFPGTPPGEAPPQSATTEKPVKGKGGKDATDAFVDAHGTPPVSA